MAACEEDAYRPAFMRNGEKVVVARRSAFNLIVVTEDESGLRTLRFGHDGVPQSIVKLGDPEHLELPYASVIPICLAFVQKPRRGAFPAP